MQAQAVFPIAQQNRVVAISPTSAARGLSAIGDFIFRTALTTDVLIPSGVRITQEKLGYTKVATIYDEIDLFSTDSDAVVKEALTANGVEILTTETLQTGETDFSAQLTRIKDSNPDAIFISAAVTETPEIMIQGRQLGIPADVPFLISVTFASSQIELAGDAAEGAIIFTSWVSTANTPGKSNLCPALPSEIRGGAKSLGSTVVCRPLYLGGSDCQRPIDRCNRNSGRAGKYRKF